LGLKEKRGDKGKKASSEKETPRANQIVTEMEEGKPVETSLDNKSEKNQT